MTNNHTLVLFDIDGTLTLYSDDFPHRMFEEMMLTFFDKTISLNDYRFSGKTDRQIISEVTTIGGIDDDELSNHEDRIVEWIPSQLESYIDDDTFRVLPNVPILLEE